MFRPVGSQPPSVYWRRRVLFVASVVALIVLIAVTVHVLLSNDTGQAGAAGAGAVSTSSNPPPSPAESISSSASQSAPSTSAGTPSSTASGSASGSRGPRASGSKSPSMPPARCQVSKLGLSAASAQSHYGMADQPVLSILVSNNGSAPCVQDLADPQIVLRVYNGESRVWGSHDCKIQPGTDDRTLMAGSTVRVSIVWSGLSSQPDCAGDRQRVGAGTYTLYASLAGREARAAQFTIN